jgi:hypothetical protein
MEDALTDGSVAKRLEIISSSARTPQDVLCGRGMPFQSYPGNVAMHELVGKHRDEYMSSKRAQKPLVIKKIIQKLKDSGARFLRPYGEFHSSEDDLWVEVDDQYIYDKISHVMRHRQRAARSEASSSAVEKGTKTTIDKSAAAIPAAGAETLSSGAAAYGSATASAGAASNQASLVGALAAGGFGGAFPQQPTLQSLLTSIVGPQNQEALLLALLSSGQTPLLSRLGLVDQSPPPLSSVLSGQNFLGMQQQQLLSQFGLQVPPQPSLDPSIFAQLRRNQLLGGIESQRLMAAVGLQSQAQPSALLNDLLNNELRLRALQQRLGLGQGQERPSEESKKDEEKG